MSLPTLRPPNMPQQSPTHLPTPPPTSSPDKPLLDGPPEQSPPPLIPLRDYDDVLLAQEAAEDSRLQARASRMWRESQEYSCAEDNETTPWLQHTRWPERFRNRPLDIITASSRLPARGCYEQNEDFTLGSWRGIPLRSSAAVEARIRVLMRAVDDMFDRAEATLAFSVLADKLQEWCIPEPPAARHAVKYWAAVQIKVEALHLLHISSS
ncbi:hypothetical protein VCV18_012604 [Metarhizium anisopliae]